MKARLLTLFVVVTSLLLALLNAGISTSPGWQVALVRSRSVGGSGGQPDVVGSPDACSPLTRRETQ